MSSASRNKGGRPPALGREHVEVLRVVVQEKPVCSLEELRRRFVERSGVPVSGPTLRKALKAAGIVRHRPPRTPRSGLEAAPKRRYGYTEAHRDEGEADRYAGGLTEAEWSLAQELFEAPDPRGRPPRYARRELVNACCYVLRTGCAWRLLPKDFPPWPAVYKAFSRWAARGVFEQFHDRLRAQWRERLGKHAVPTAAILDSQSTRISPQGGESGYDAGKKVKGRKRHLLVDTLGLLLTVVVTAASVQDRDGALPSVAPPARNTPPSPSCTWMAPMPEAAPNCCTRPMDWTWRSCATPPTATSVAGICIKAICSMPHHRRVSWSCPSDGWSNGPTPGSNARVA